MGKTKGKCFRNLQNEKEINEHDETENYAEVPEIQLDLSSNENMEVNDASQDDVSVYNNSRLARFEKQLLERSSNIQENKSNKRDRPSNVAAFISDANLKRAESLHERNEIELRRVEIEKTETAILKERFDLEKAVQMEQITINKEELNLKDHERILNEKMQLEKLHLKKQFFDLKRQKLALKQKEQQDSYKLKVLEMEKAERMEKLKMEYEYKLQVELAKLKQQ